MLQRGTTIVIQYIRAIGARRSIRRRDGEPFYEFPRSWVGRSFFILVFLLAWFGLQFPLVPTTGVGFAVNVAFALVVLGYAAFALRSIVWLSKTALNPNLKSTLGCILAASVGIAIFAAAYFSRGFLSINSAIENPHARRS